MEICRPGFDIGGAEWWNVLLLLAIPTIISSGNTAQLLEYYRQGLELQSRLIELYRERQGEDGG